MPIGGNEDQRPVAKDVVVTIDDVVSGGVAEIPEIIWFVGATRPRHLTSLDEKRRLREKRMAAAVIKVNVRNDDRRDVRRAYPDTRELAHHLIADLGADGKARRSPKRPMGSVIAWLCASASKSTRPLGWRRR